MVIISWTRLSTIALEMHKFARYKHMHANSITYDSIPIKALFNCKTIIFFIFTNLGIWNQQLIFSYQ